jgi:hypothetical protein
MAEYTCCSSVASERPNENSLTCTFPFCNPSPHLTSPRPFPPALSQMPDTYYVRVAAYNAMGPSAFSATVSTTTGQRVPGSPQGVTLTVLSPVQILVSWTAPSTQLLSFGGDGGSPLLVCVRSPRPPPPIGWCVSVDRAVVSEYDLSQHSQRIARVALCRATSLSGTRTASRVLVPSTCSTVPP